MDDINEMLFEVEYNNHKIEAKNAIDTATSYVSFTVNNGGVDSTLKILEKEDLALLLDAIRQEYNKLIDFYKNN